MKDPITGNPITLQYVLHTFDEMTADEQGFAVPFVAQGGIGQYSHVLGLRTSIGTDSQGHYIGGKVVRYDDWQCNFTAPPGFQRSVVGYRLSPAIRILQLRWAARHVRIVSSFQHQ